MHRALRHFGAVASKTGRQVATRQARPRGAPSFCATYSLDRRSFSSFDVTFVTADGGSEFTVPAKPGQTILEVAHDNNIDIEGACGGQCACSTCHVILAQDVFDRLPEVDEDEADMLDLAVSVTDTSRLGCQVKLEKGRDEGMRITIPEGVANMLS
eukprot:TRINITY_DN74464_c0_g1_i1.p1 TRINITY_DN74464_c0_g1~~TRINITY_DN74464_c0_g1_i1.p1  ORF type:complete len:156 (-),score=18.04 TRINITY_DN74464_c0_g1_i1:165-632(-)